MTIAQFKALVESWMNRTTGSFTIGTTDCLLAAMNDARRYAMRSHNFEMLRTQECYINACSVGTNWQTGCFTTPVTATQTAMVMKRIDSIWQYSQSTISGTTYFQPTARIRFDTSGDLKRALPTYNTSYLTVNQVSQYTTEIFGYVVGSQFYITGIAAFQWVKLFGIQWLPDLVGSESPDIFLTYFTDWFRIATIFFLNTYLKDNERFQIDAQQMKLAWDTMVQMDGDVANMGEQANLD